MLNAEKIIKRSEKYLQEVNNIAEKKLAEKRIRDVLQEYKGDDSVVEFQTVYDEVATRPVRPVLETGYLGIDDDLGGGFNEGELVLLGGFSGNGKTNFAFNLTEKMEKYKPFWLPFEENAEEYAEKLLKWKKKALKFYVPKKMIKEDIEWIEERILEAKIKHDCKVVFIDNLHFITMEAKGDAYFHKLGETAKHLKKLAGKLKLVIVLIVHLRKTKDGLSKMPTLDDVSGNSDIIKVANTAMILWRESKRETNGKIVFTGNNFISIQKSRAGAKQETHLFSWDKGVFKEESTAALLKVLKEAEETYEPPKIF